MHNNGIPITREIHRHVGSTGRNPRVVLPENATAGAELLPDTGLARVLASKALPALSLCHVVLNTFSVILYQAVASPRGSIIRILCSCTFSRY